MLTHPLASFGFHAMMDLRTRLRSLFDEAPETIEEGAERVVALLRSSLVDERGEAACALVRVYKTHPYALLDEELQAFARRVSPDVDTIPDLRCLVLLATAGDEPAWSSRHNSRGHKCIPLSSEKAVEDAPMIAHLIRQLGIELATVLRPSPGLLLDAGETSHNVFYVATAAGSPYIVAQEEFVKPYGVQSVIGFGGMAAAGDLYAAILFSKVSIPEDVADRFRVIGLNFKLAMLSLGRKPLFRAP